VKGLGVVIACLLMSGGAFAQTSNATLGGTVADRNDGLLPGVAISAVNVQTGVTSRTASNRAGVYYFASLQPGTYRIRAEIPGFEVQVYTDVILGLSQRVRLNFTLSPGSITQINETNASDSSFAAASSSSALFEYGIQDLPLAGGNVLDLITTTPGTQGSNFAGGRINQVNTARDGISVNDGRYENGVYSQTYMSTDLVNEVRIMIAPTDAEVGRGSGQVLLSTRSGTNQYHGSLFWTDRNSALDASTWFNNFRGQGKDYLNRNQFGARLGGPIVKNKTFFFVLFEGMRTVQKTSTFGDVLTAPARQGIFRYFPGVQNGNVNASIPTVDQLGNPVQPASATGPLRSFNMFGRDVNGVFTPWDPLRPGFDPSGLVKKIFDQMPLPNDFTQHDGLNWGHYTWIRRSEGVEDILGLGTDINRNQFNFRVDHYLNSRHRLNVSGTREHTWAENNLSTWPNGYNGQITRRPNVYTASLVSSLRSSLVNEFRFGFRRGSTEDLLAYDLPGKRGEDARKLLGQANGIAYIVRASFLVQGFGIYDQSGTFGSVGNTTPLYTYADTLNWVRGKHAFSSGGELRFGSSNAFNSSNIMPRVVFGAGVPVSGIDGTNMPGLTGADQGQARALLADLAGSILQINETFTLAPDPTHIAFTDFRDQTRRYRDIHQNEWSAFFKDDWKLRPNLTLNVGARYEFYGVPYEADGLAAAPVGGGNVILNGSTSIAPELIGKNSAQPDKQLYKNDRNNFGPAVGLSWSVPYFGKDKTIVRAGYGISYELATRIQKFDLTVGGFPGLNQAATHPPGTTYLNLMNITLPIPEKAPSGSLLTVPLTARNDTVNAWDPNLATPYVQNWSLDVQRSLSRDFTANIRYIGTKGTRLISAIPENYVNIFDNGLLEAFNLTRAGGNALLFDRLLKGLTVNGSVVDGTNFTGSQALRLNSNSSGPLARGAIFNFATYLNSTANFAGQPGGLLRNGLLPEDFIVKNPQFANAWYYSNPGNSTYHSMQLAIMKRLSHGFSNQTTYTWSRALGEADGNVEKQYLDPFNRSLDKSLLTFHRTHDIRSNGTFELPFGPGRFFLNNAPSLISRLVERWELGAIFSLTSGQPLSITSLNTVTGALNMPMIVGDFPKSSGKVTRVSNGIVYFPDLSLAPDPSRATVTTLQGLNTQNNLFALADSKGRIVLQSAAPGAVGNLGQKWIEGPRRTGLDMDLVKRMSLGEEKNLELRVSAVNVLNHPQFANPVIGLQLPNFGRIVDATGNRQFTFNARFSF
jgi:hypothetical protein